MVRTEWALNCCFAWTFGTAAVLAQGGGGVVCRATTSPPNHRSTLERTQQYKGKPVFPC